VAFEKQAPDGEEPGKRKIIKNIRNQKRRRKGVQELTTKS